MLVAWVSPSPTNIFVSQSDISSRLVLPENVLKLVESLPAGPALSLDGELLLSVEMSLLDCGGAGGLCRSRGMPNRNPNSPPMIAPHAITPIGDKAKHAEAQAKRWNACIRITAPDCSRIDANTNQQCREKTESNVFHGIELPDHCNAAWILTIDFVRRRLLPEFKPCLPNVHDITPWAAHLRLRWNYIIHRFMEIGLGGLLSVSLTLN